MQGSHHSFKWLSFAIILFILLSNLFAQNSIRIATYNVLNYPNNDSNIRNPYFRTVIQETNPDILVVQEMATTPGFYEFLNSVLNFSGADYNGGTFIFRPGGNNALYYKHTLFQFISNTPINGGIRDINEFKLVHILSGDTLRIYSVHLKAGSDTSDVTRRAAEVDSLRQVTDQLPPGTHFVVCGDFNIQESGEPAFQELLLNTGMNEGYVIDPLNLVGLWHNNFSFAPYHTQSTRVSSFGGGSTGGLDDRFDMILTSRAVIDTGGATYTPNSYVTFGNDGQHFNDSINQMPNNAVSQAVANALYFASDHLPVYCTLNFGTTTVTTDSQKVLISEFVVTPTAGEFIEIYNPNSSPVVLSNYYLTDATFANGGAYYYNIVTGSNYGGGGFGDFHARFPDGAVILPGEYQTVALNGDFNFYNSYGVLPTYELYEDGNSVPQDVPDMREAVPGSINGQGGLTNGDEVIILYNWDGYSDLVQDVDYVIYDDAGQPPNEAVDKTGVLIDGPDGDTTPSAYLDDTPIAQQLPAPSPPFGFSTQRIDFSEGLQTSAGGNGITGADETSENLNLTFTSTNAPSPNQPFPFPKFDISGTVLLEDPLDPLSNTIVTIQRQGMFWLDTTDVSGFYQFTALDSGAYQLTFEHDGYIPLDSVIYLDQNLVINVSLSKVSGGTFQMPVASGWNLIGLPLEVTDPSVSTLFPNSVSGTLFGWNGSYVQEDSMGVGEGYWLRFPAGETVTIEGQPTTGLTLNLMNGWNMVSGPSCDVSLADVNDPGGIIVAGTLFGFDGAYILSDSLQQGRGYWLRTNATGEITIGCASVIAMEDIPQLNKAWKLSTLPALKIRDAAGANQTLYFEMKLENPQDKLSFSLPPLPPPGAFDARFEGDFRICEELVPGSTEGIIHLQSSNYPVTVNFSNIPGQEKYGFVLTEVANGKEAAIHDIVENNKIVIRDPGVTTLRLSKIQNTLFSFEVLQNYPNPFNPLTEIRYSIPAETRVEITIYNALGQKVKTLLSAREQAGEKVVFWDATNELGKKVSSGIYYYRVSTGQFSAVKKMILMK